jgi:hypothetical protein
MGGWPGKNKYTEISLIIGPPGYTLQRPVVSGHACFAKK